MRKDISFRHATSSDLDRISYTISISKWTTKTALSKRANRVLGFFASLNRCGEFGYRGTRCCQAALSRAISRSTGEAASIATLQRALRELREAGFLDVGTAYGKPRRTAADTFQREPIRVYSLTDRATALWSTPKSHKRLPLSTPINLTPFRKKEPVIESQSFTRAPVDTLSCPSLSVSVCEKVAVRTIQDSTVRAKREGKLSRWGEERKSRQSRFKSIPTHSVMSARKRILAELCAIVETRGRAGKMIAAKAAACLADPPESSPVDWNYWVTRWPAMSAKERGHALRNEIIAPMNTWVEPERLEDPKITEAPSGPIDSNEDLEGLRRAGFDVELITRLSSRVS